MTNKTYFGGYLAVSAAFLFAAFFAAPGVTGAEFKLGGADVTFSSQLSVGSSWRVENRDSRLVTSANATGMPNVAGSASSSTADDGNLNFDQGEIYSLIVKGSHDLQISGENMGAFVRFKYWYDEELEEGRRAHGNLLNRYRPNERLDDSGFDDFAKASGLELLDAYFYASFFLGDNIPLDLRFGRQVLSWGESTFIQNGVNSINPVDVSAFRRPGAEIKEGLLPLNMFSMSAGLTDNLSLEAFYQLNWEKTVVDGCGTYFSSVDVAAGGCDGVVITTLVPDRAALGVFSISRNPDLDPDDNGQFGIAMRYFAENLNGTEFGAYFINIHSRFPLFSGNVSSNPGGTLFIPGNPLGGNPTYTVEFPEDIKIYGATFATNVAGYAVSGEISYRPEEPVQLNTNDLLAAAVGGAPYSPLTVRAQAAAPGALVNGFDRLPVTQAQLTVIKFFDRVMGASRLSVAAEVGANFVGSLASQSDLRYGRSSNWGNAFDPIPVTQLGIPIPGDFLTCEGGYRTPAGFPATVIIGAANINPSSCKVDGFVTDTSWGYRIRGGLTYNDAFAGINLTPNLAWAHDVDGNSPNPNFLEGRKALSVGLKGEYLNKYSASFSYTVLSGGEWNTQTDRDFVSLSFDVTF
ncbi:MAG: DUF1302 domain-containing protein [Gammaproteobacteria bacterium]|nr:DUF1302 domain-containing protein [Gammaproteobacteria bacterium]